MPRIIDSFLFFQELDLLEIRLKYLDSYVDCFVIVEACQTFTGKPKEFVFEKHSERFKQYLPKIKYYKITDFHNDYDSVRDYLASFDDASHRKVLSILENHTHYAKSKLHWVLDSYHRECLHLALDEVAEDEDIVLISDLDEIPSAKTFKSETMNLAQQEPQVYQQHEFRYFLNYYKDSDWLGTIASRYEFIKNVSYNLLRMDSKKVRNMVAPISIKDAGFHFTSCGGIEMIKEKIKSWGHQEFNNALVMKNLEANIKAGQDIFMRESGTNLTRIDVFDEHFFDKRMSDIISQYHDLISREEILSGSMSIIKSGIQKILITLQKLKYKLSMLRLK